LPGSGMYPLGNLLKSRCVNEGVTVWLVFSPGAVFAGLQKPEGEKCPRKNSDDNAAKSVEEKNLKKGKSGRSPLEKTRLLAKKNEDGPQTGGAGGSSGRTRLGIGCIRNRKRGVGKGERGRKRGEGKRCRHAQSERGLSKRLRKRTRFSLEEGLNLQRRNYQRPCTAGGLRAQSSLQM